MAYSNKISINTRQFTELAEKLDELAGSQGLKDGIQNGLKKAKEKTNERIEEALQLPNLPARGRYSMGDTLDSLNRDDKVNWDGNIASIDIGWDFKNDRANALTSVYLMYGTPDMAAVNGLEDAIYNSKAKNTKIIKEELQNAIKKVMK